MTIKNRIKVFFYLLLIFGIIGVLFYYESFKKIVYSTKIRRIKNESKNIFTKIEISTKPLVSYEHVMEKERV
jgi:hypothetical protein